MIVWGAPSLSSGDASEAELFSCELLFEENFLNRFGVGITLSATRGGQKAREVQDIQEI